jgi:hypothetical protein
MKISVVLEKLYSRQIVESKRGDEMVTIANRDMNVIPLVTILFFRHLRSDEKPRHLPTLAPRYSPHLPA